jgi:Ycf66 protein N-terminus
VNFGTPVPLLVGIVLILAAVGLFFLDKFKPGFKRDSDTVYSILFLTVGILSLFQLNQDFLPSFQLMIFAGMLIALMLESIRRRTPGGANTLRPEPDGRSEPVARSESSGRYREPRRAERETSYNSYEYDEPTYRSEIQAQFDDGPVVMEQRSNQRQIRGSRETRDNRRAGRDYPEPETSRDDYRRDNRSDSRSLEPSNHFDDYSESPQESRESRRSRRRPSSTEDYDSSYDSSDKQTDSSSRRSGKQRGQSLETDEPSYGSVSNYGTGSPSADDSLDLLSKGSRKSRSSNSPISNPVSSDEPTYSGAPRRRPKPKLNLDEDDAPVAGGDYVDYQPLDKPLSRDNPGPASTTSNLTGESSGLNGSSLDDESARSRRRRRSENLGGNRLGNLGDPLDLGSTDDDF